MHVYVLILVLVIYVILFPVKVNVTYCQSTVYIDINTSVIRVPTLLHCIPVFTMAITNILIQSSNGVKANGL